MTDEEPQDNGGDETPVASPTTDAVYAFRRLVRRLGGRRVQPWQFEIPYYLNETVGTYLGGVSSWCRFTVEADGSLTRTDQRAPDRIFSLFSDEDRAIIRAAAPRLRKFPEVLPLPVDENGRVQTPWRKDHKSRVFVHRDVTGVPIFAVERIETGGTDSSGEKAAKRYPAHFFTNTGWRVGDPPISLPLFGSHDLRDDLRPVMLHEGSKAAHHARVLVGVDEFWCSITKTWRREPHLHHPLYEWLSQFVHVGWHGADHGIEIADWSALRGRVVHIMADMDDDGMSHAQRAADRLLEYGVDKVYVPFWTQKMRELNRSWDVADSLPETVFGKLDLSEEAHRKRPKCFPKSNLPGADYLTVPDLRFAFYRYLRVEEPYVVEVTDKKGNIEKITRWRLRQDFIRSWVYCSQTECFHDEVYPNRSYTKEQFNDRFASLAPNLTRAKQRVGQLLMEQKHEDLVTDSIGNFPQAERVFVEFVQSAPRRVLNMHIAGPVTPKAPPSAAGWPAGRDLLDMPEFRLVRLLFERIAPNPEDRKVLVRWMAHVAANPGEKITWMPILISKTQGIGKSLCIHLLTELIGVWNCASISIERITESRFTDFLLDVCLVELQEIDTSGSRAVYNRFKHHVTDTVFEVEIKYVKGMTKVVNRVNYIGSSNRELPFMLEESDRRIYPVVSDCKQVFSEAAELLHWFRKEEGARYLLWAAKVWYQQHQRELADPATRAAALARFHAKECPLNEVKREMIKESRFPWEAKLDEILGPYLAIRDEAGRRLEPGYDPKVVPMESNEVVRLVDTFSRFQLEQAAKGPILLLSDLRTYLAKLPGIEAPRSERAIRSYLADKYGLVSAHPELRDQSIFLKWINTRFYALGDPADKNRLAPTVEERLMLFSQEYSNRRNMKIGEDALARGDTSVGKTVDRLESGYHRFLNKGEGDGR